jgi:two-component sensor histidine kinase
VFRALAVALAAMAFAILVAWYVSRRFVAAPVAALVHVADRWRKGDLTARAEIQGDDEFARLGQAFDQAMEQAKKREDRITLLVKEITHRVKNQMSVMASMARQSGRNAANVADFQKAFSNRIMALARSHDLVFADAGEARLRTLIEAQLAPFAGSGRLKLSGPDILIDPQATQYLGMGLHELATNAVKYGALSKEGGRVEIAWEILPVDGTDTLRVTWTEHGGPPPAASPTEGFGTVVLDKIVGSALGGRTSYRLEDGGATWTCAFTAHFTIPTQESTQGAENSEAQDPA